MEKFETEHIPKSKDSIENNEEKESSEFLSDQVYRYRDKEIVESAIHELVNDFKKDNHENLIIFNKEFKKSYIEFKLKLTILIKKINKFLHSPHQDEYLEQIKKSYSEIFPSGGYDFSWYEDYKKEYDETRDFIYDVEYPDLIEQITGESLIHNVDLDFYGTAIVFRVYEKRDYYKFSKNKKVKITAGFYRENFKFKNQKGENREIPIIVLNADIDDDDFLNSFDKEFGVNFNDYLEECYKNETGEDPFNYDVDDFTDDFKEWEQENDNNVTFHRFIEETITEDSYPSYDKFVVEEAYNDYLFLKEGTDLHEKQHHKYRKSILEVEDIAFSLDSKEEVSIYLKRVLEDFIISLGDELIAYMKDSSRDIKKLESDLRIKTTSVYDKKHKYSIEELNYKHTLDVDESDFKKDFNNYSKISLTNKLYFYPSDYKKDILKQIKDKVGEEKYLEWEIEDLYKEKVNDKFREFKKRIQKIATQFVRELSKKGMNVDSVIDLLEVEPVENWVILYRWFKNDSELFNSNVLTDKSNI
jgi:hypothetical protein